MGWSPVYEKDEAESTTTELMRLTNYEALADMDFADGSVPEDAFGPYASWHRTPPTRLPRRDTAYSIIGEPSWGCPF